MNTHAAPDLPAGIAWITAVTEAAGLVGTGVVPLVLPADQERARRWARVLHSYGDLSAFTPGRCDPQRIVVSVGDTAEIGQTAAAALGRTHRHVPDVPSVSTLVVPADASLLLVAAPADCTFAALHPILQSWHGEGVKAGVLTGRDEAGMFFSLAKIVADQHGSAPTPEADVRFDGTTGTALVNGTDRPALAEALTSTWRCIVVDAHGTGSHVPLGSYILCGLSGDREHVLDHNPMLDGCTNGHCRGGRGVLEPVLVRDLKCRTLALFVCNGITLNPEEQFPSDVTLALAALEGFPATIIGLLRQDTDTSATESSTVAHLLASGVPNGTVAAWLTQDASSRGRPSAYLLLGDPEQTQPATRPPMIPVCWPHGQWPVLPAIVDGAGRPVSAVLTRDGAIAPPEAADPLRIWDAASEVTTTVSELAQWVTDCDEASHLEDALRALMTDTSKRRTVLSACLDRMQQHRLDARRLALHGIRQAQTYRRTQRGAPTEPPHVALREHALGWVAALHESVLARAGAFRLWEALEANHYAYQAVSDTACWRCQAPRTRTELASPMSGLGDRVSITCPRCGPSAHFPALQSVEVHGPDMLHRGGVADVTVAIPPISHETPDIGLLAVQLQDRAGLKALTQQSCTARPGEHHVLSVPVPPDLAPDLHRLWILWGHRFHVSLLQLRVPTAPAFASETRETT
ncbi:hypothetical protein [Amycolatopsis cihanbeyliensis]|uniref:Uncharacterized protein n=1 Tax=Amycolatopsis cihanbeyliensis TaxID=1128664 RepID=A0A542DPU9_AMYCI|nr:hypothetical protein [Amycolatopsis cihanbeyliensis]TQJ05086.1 hypothetical protein FB471_4909 [Amycolatopsis cihanbeyliensis]